MSARNRNRFGLTAGEYGLLLHLKSPFRIQEFLDHDIHYNKELGGETCRSPRRVIRDRLAHCIEGALFAAAALRVLGHPPLLLDLEAVRDDDHVLAVFRQNGSWGAIAKSNYAGLRFREPIYRTLRELVMSYFEHYYNTVGEKTLRAYSTRPVHLARFDRSRWMTAEEELWEIGDWLSQVAHTQILATAQVRALSPMDHRSFLAGHTGAVK